MTLTAAQQQLIAEVARSQVGEIAPHEAALFRATSEAYFKRPNEPQRRQVGDCDMLGFGAGGAVTFLTPVILAIATDVVTFLAVELSKQLKVETTDAITALVKRLFKPLRSKVDALGAGAGGGAGRGRSRRCPSHRRCHSPS